MARTRKTAQRKTSAKKTAVTRTKKTAVARKRKAAGSRTSTAVGRTAAPKGYTTAAPYLIVAGASGTIDFLTQVLDAREVRRMTDPTGKIRHAEVRIGDSLVMLGDSFEGWPAQPSHVHVYVQDVDVTYRRALAAGATSVQEPIQKEDEDKRGGVKDAGGTTWWIATRVG
jgi:PhnB protein